MILLLILFGTSYADHTELLVGGITAHFTNYDQADRNFDNKLNRSGEVIANGVISVREVRVHDDHYATYGAFTGQNSIGQPMVGLLTSAGIVDGQNRYGLAAGGYAQNDNKFRERNITPFTISESQGIGLVPVVGIEWTHTYKNFLTNVLVTPILGNVSIGWRF